VFRATTKEGFLAVKIYRIATSTYKHLAKYIVDDPRFRSIRSDRRHIILAWAKKEFKNLVRMHRAGVTVPEPIKVKENILVMGYVGDESAPAPLLKDVVVDNAADAFEYIINDYIKAYHKAEIVHGDLSEYNILVQQGRYYFIDVGQGVLRKHPMARIYLERDIHNICRYFNKLGLNVEEKKVIKRVVRGK